MREVLRQAFEAAVAAAHPEHCLPPFLKASSIAGRTFVVAVGKAAVPMAAVAADILGSDVEVIVVTRHGHKGDSVLPTGLEVIESAHPVPDEAGMNAARTILDRVRALGEDDRLIALISGGGSSLLTLPGHGVTLKDKQAISRALLNSGASISEINCVRKHISAIKGGRLAYAAWPARVETYCISDVPGDDPALIASGPTVTDRTTLADARAVLARYHLDHHENVMAALRDPRNETPSPDNSQLAGQKVMIVAKSKDAIKAASQCVSTHGYRPVCLGEVEGLAAEVADEHAKLALAMRAKGERVALISGGECTVRRDGSNAKGGPNGEYLLALAKHLGGEAGVSALACDTDGIDGSGDNAGAIIDPTTPQRATGKGLDLTAMLEDHRSYDFFAELGDLVTTGPTLTNVNDIRVILIEPE